MSRHTRRNRGAVIGAVLALFVGLSEPAGAQHTGLFPLAPIKRERVPCQNEDPIYKLYKQQYFGYHPTYWRTFPAGWGVRSEEAPDRVKSFTERQLDQPLYGNPAAEEGRDEGQGVGRPGEAPGRNEPLEPLVPEGRSPFELDDTPPAAPPRDGTAPRAAPPTNRRSPFEDVDQGAAAPSRGGAPERPAISGAPEGAPELTAPGAVGASNDEIERIEPGTDQPLLAVGDLDVSRASRDAADFDAQAAQPAETAVAAPPAPAPRRRWLSGLFDDLRSNWLRR